MAADPSSDMNIWADPANSGGYKTTYTFRGNFGPTDYVDRKSNQCSDQTLDFAQFYTDPTSAAISGLSAFSGVALASLVVSNLF